MNKCRLNKQKIVLHLQSCVKTPLLPNWRKSKNVLLTQSYADKPIIISVYGKQEHLQSVNKIKHVHTPVARFRLNKISWFCKTILHTSHINVQNLRYTIKKKNNLLKRNVLGEMLRESASKWAMSDSWRARSYESNLWMNRSNFVLKMIRSRIVAYLKIHSPICRIGLNQFSRTVLESERIFRNMSNSEWAENDEWTKPEWTDDLTNRAKICFIHTNQKCAGFNQ